MRLDRGLCVYLFTVFVTGAYFFWRLFLKTPSTIPLVGAVGLFGAYVCISFLLMNSFCFKFLERLFCKLKSPKVALTLVFVVALVLFLSLRLNGLVYPVLNNEGDATHFIVWQNGTASEISPEEASWEDESKNFAMAQLLQKRGALNFVNLYEPNKLYSNIFVGHPPLFSVFMSEASHLLAKAGVSIPQAMRLLVFFMMLVNVLLIFMLYKHLVSEQDAFWVATLFLSFPYYFFYFGCRAQNDQMITLFVLLFALINVLALRKNDIRLTLFAGVTLGLALWTKYTALLALGAISLVWLFNLKNISIGRKLTAVITQTVLGFFIFGLWIYLIKGTEVGEVQYARYIGKLLGQALDPANLGHAQSGGRGGIKTMLLNLPFDLGLPQFILCVLGSWIVITKREWKSIAIWVASWLLVFFAATFLVIPKLNYILPAAHALSLLAVFGARHVGFSRKISYLLLLQCIFASLLKISIWSIEG